MRYYETTLKEKNKNTDASVSQRQSRWDKQSGKKSPWTRKLFHGENDHHLSGYPSSAGTMPHKGNLNIESWAGDFNIDSLSTQEISLKA